MRKLAIVFAALCVLPLRAMERDQSSSHASSNNNEKPLGTAVKVLEVMGNFLSLLESVAKNLKERDALKVSTLTTMLDAADSRWKSGAVYSIEKIVGVTPPFAVPYLQRAAGAFHTQGPTFINFLVGQKKEKKSLSDLLRTFRHGTRYLAPNREAFNEFFATNQPTINALLNDYYPVLPALAAGVRAAHASLAVSVNGDAQDSAKKTSQEEVSYSPKNNLLDELRFVRSVLAYMRNEQYGNDLEDDACDVCAEYDRISKEAASIGLRIQSVDEEDNEDVFYDAETIDINQCIDLDWRTAQGRDEGMTDWLK